VTTLAVLELTVPQALTVMVTTAQSAHVHVGTLETPLSPAREESANHIETAEITRLAMLTHARILVTLTWALFVVIMPNVLLGIINLYALAHLVMMVTLYSHAIQDLPALLLDVLNKIQLK